MQSRLACCLALANALGAGAAMGQAIPCGEPYEVQRGDTLQRIAERAYGPDASFRDLIAANRRAFVGGDPSLIAVGQRLDVPCRAPAAVTADVMPATLRAVAASTGLAPTTRPTFDAVLTRAGLPPVSEAAPGTDPLAALSAGGGATLVVGAARPDCTEGGHALCDDLVWSAPVAEVVVSTFTRADQGPVTLRDALAGRPVCIGGNLPAYLSEGVPAAGSGEVVADAATCLTRLRTGAVDAAIMAASEADSALEAIGPGAAIVEQFALARLVTLHVVASPSNEAAAEALSEIDAAIAAMRADGTWMAALAGAGTPN